MNAIQHPRGCLAAGALLTALALATGCQDASRIFEPAPLTEAPAVAALAHEQAALLSVALDDALTRLLPMAGDGQPSQRAALSELAADLAVADAVTLAQRLSAARASVAGLDLDPADADALQLTLEAIDQAIDPVRSR